MERPTPQGEETGGKSPNIVTKRALYSKNLTSPSMTSVDRYYSTNATRADHVSQPSKTKSEKA